MARDIICDLDQVERAAWMIGELGTGNQLAVCDGCLVMWCLAHLETHLGEEGKAIVVQQWAPAPAPGAQEGPGAPERPKSGPRRARRPRRVAGAQDRDDSPPPAAAEAVQAPGPEPAQGVAEAPAAPDDR